MKRKLSIHEEIEYARLAADIQLLVAEISNRKPQGYEFQIGGCASQMRKSRTYLKRLLSGFNAPIRPDEADKETP